MGRRVAGMKREGTEKRGMCIEIAVNTKPFLYTDMYVCRYMYESHVNVFSAVFIREQESGSATYIYLAVAFICNTSDSNLLATHPSHLNHTLCNECRNQLPARVCV